MLVMALSMLLPAPRLAAGAAAPTTTVAAHTGAKPTTTIRARPGAPAPPGAASTTIASKTPAPPFGCGMLSGAALDAISTAEPWYCPINNLIYKQWVSVAPLAFAVLLIAFTIAGLIFMIGIVMKSDRIRNFGIGELYEAVASAIVVAIFMYLSAVLFGYTPGLFVGPINPYAISFHLIDSTLSQAQSLYTSIFNPYMTDSFLLSIRPQFGGAIVYYIPSALTNFFGGVGKILLTALSGIFTVYLELFFLAPASVIETFLLDGMLALNVEYYLLMFFAIAAIPAFLIPGVVFRAILPTRALGSVLVALAIAFYLIMPLLFSVAYYFTSPLLIANMQAYVASLSRFGAGSGAATNALSSVSPLVITLASVNVGISGFWLLTLFYPAIIIAITYAFVVEFSNIMGGFAPLMSGSIRRVL